MFRIGDFARINKVSVKTLHHYDELGILQPESTDQYTGYRYYSAGQMAKLNQILAFKEAGFSLAEIGEIFLGSYSREQLIKLLEQKAAALEAAARQEQDRVSRIMTNIFLIKNGGIPLMNEITIKKVEPILVAALRSTISDYEEMGGLWEELNSYIDELGIKKIIPCMTLYHNGWDLAAGMDIEVIEPVARNLPGNNRIQVYQLAPIAKMACLVHNGSFATMGQTYGTLAKWMLENGYELAGPIREIYHRGEWATANPDEYVTEIQYPLKGH